MHSHYKNFRQIKVNKCIYWPSYGNAVLRTPLDIMVNKGSLTFHQVSYLINVLIASLRISQEPDIE